MSITLNPGLHAIRQHSDRADKMVNTNSLSGCCRYGGQKNGQHDERQSTCSGGDWHLHAHGICLHRPDAGRDPHYGDPDFESLRQPGAQLGVGAVHVRGSPVAGLALPGGAWTRRRRWRQPRKLAAWGQVRDHILQQSAEVAVMPPLFAFGSRVHRVTLRQ